MHDRLRIVIGRASQYGRAFAYVMHLHENRHIKRAGEAGIALRAKVQLWILIQLAEMFEDNHVDVSNFKKICDKVVLEDSQMNNDVEGASRLIYELCKDHIYEVSKKTHALIKHVIFENIVHQEQLLPYLGILEFIHSAARYRDGQEREELKSDNKPFEKWQDVIVTAYTAREAPHFHKENSVPSGYNKIIEFSNSCRDLLSYGIEFKYHDDNISIDEGSYSRVLEIIDEFVDKIGGGLILEFTFNLLSRDYEPSQERFQVYRKTTQGVDYIRPEIPWGYIIALGSKNLHRGKFAPRAIAIKQFKPFVEFMVNVVSSFEIQPYVIWEAIHVDRLRLVEFLQENVLYDNLVSFFQIKSSYAIDIIKNISTYYALDELKSYEFKIKDIINIGLNLIELAAVGNVSLISRSRISKKSGIQAKVMDNIIDRVFCSKNVSELGFPPSSESVEHVLTPLLPYNGLYVVLPKSLTSLSVLNCILNQISKPSGVFDNAKDSSVGRFLEHFVWIKANQQGVKCYRGDYISKNKKINGDCDLLIKTNRFIYLFEIKKKALTRKAMSGTDYQIIKDLGDSVIRSQSQCAKTEYVLLFDKELELKCNGKSEVITYEGQRIFKISLSLHDFGALQDSIILSTILMLSVQVNFNTNNKEIQHFLLSWNSYLNTFKDYTNKSKELLNYEDPTFKNNIFMSIPQLLTILTNVNNEDEFSLECSGGQSITYSTRCFYKEYSLRNRLKKH